MNKKNINLILITLALSSCIALFVADNTLTPGLEPPSATTGVGDVETLEANYRAWEADYEKTGGDRNIVLSIGWFKGLSTESTNASGLVKLNLIDGVVSVKAKGLSPLQSWDIWLVDNRSGAGRTVLPEPGDDLM